MGKQLAELMAQLFTLEIESVLGRTTDPVFLDRYALAHHAREWEDRYARGFHTALHLWVPRGEGKK